MDQKFIPTVKLAAEALERIQEEFEALGESEDCLPLRKGGERLLEILVLLNGLDPNLLNSKSLARIAAGVETAKAKSGRNSFNTGF